MDAIFQLANESKLNFNIPKVQELNKVWSSLWDQCEAANEIIGNKTCFPKPSNKSISNALKMLTVFQNELKRRELDSRAADGEILSDDQFESSGLSRSQKRLLEDRYGSKGKTNEYLLSESNSPSNVGYSKQPPYELYDNEEELDNEEPRGIKGSVPKTTALVKQRNLYPLERETRYMVSLTNALVQLLPNFTKYDPNKDLFTNMCLFEDECSQHNLGPRESCLMMKLWLPSNMAVRLTSPVARPAGGSQFLFSDSHWGDKQDRLKALAFLATGEDNFGIEILEDLKVTPKDDPWEFARKFVQVYQLVMGVTDSSVPSAMLKALLNKFTYLNCATRTAASKEKTVNGIVTIVDKYRRNPCVEQMGMMMMDRFSTTLYQRSMAETPVRLRSPQDTLCDASSSQPTNVRSFSKGRPEDLHVERNETGYTCREDGSVLLSDAGDPDISEVRTMFSRNAVKQ